MSLMVRQDALLILSLGTLHLKLSSSKTTSRDQLTVLLLRFGETVGLTRLVAYQASARGGWLTVSIHSFNVSIGQKMAKCGSADVRLHTAQGLFDLGALHLK